MKAIEPIQDPLDFAARLTETLARASEDAIRRLAQPEQVRDADGNWPRSSCVDCDEPIGTDRLEQGRVRCIDCQTILEKKKTMFATR